MNIAQDAFGWGSSVCSSVVTCVVPYPDTRARCIVGSFLKACFLLKSSDVLFSVIFLPVVGLSGFGVGVWEMPRFGIGFAWGAEYPCLLGVAGGSIWVCVALRVLPLQGVGVTRRAMCIRGRHSTIASTFIWTVFGYSLQGTKMWYHTVAPRYASHHHLLGAWCQTTRCVLYDG